MGPIRINLKERSYDIVIGSGILGTFGNLVKRLDCGGNAILVTNPGIAKLWGGNVADTLKRNSINVRFEEVPASEKSKSIVKALDLLNRIAVFGRSRSVFIIAFGGGVVGDLAGFVASIYKRGIPYIQLPTTLLAQVDSSIGGKVAIDLKVGKNLAGSFYQPRMVFSETSFLKTLPKKELTNGLAEAVKYAVISSAPLFEFIEANLDKILGMDEPSIVRTVSTCSRIKARIVERDEYDNHGIRAVLNYGHTIGHAIETASEYSKGFTHGEAISVGMVAANLISRNMGMLSRTAFERIRALLQSAGLPVSAAGISPKRIYEAHLYDKKFSGGRNRFVLATAIGEARIARDVPEPIIKKAINSVCAA
ncbi:MAG: 3-dehydroquinate synthase [Candidatus Omnitrophica bacterium]|nr:3-dehydroquinate synthase [Candidatus Omnitrophota bacterium]